MPTCSTAELGYLSALPAWVACRGGEPVCMCHVGCMDCMMSCSPAWAMWLHGLHELLACMGHVGCMDGMTCSPAWAMWTAWTAGVARLHARQIFRIIVVLGAAHVANHIAMPDTLALRPPAVWLPVQSGAYMLWDLSRLGWALFVFIGVGVGGVSLSQCCSVLSTTVVRHRT